MWRQLITRSICRCYSNPLATARHFWCTYAPQACFLTVIEPYEKESLVQFVAAPSADELIVKLKDGREHCLHFFGMEGEGNKLGVKVQEWKEGELVREEITK